MLDPVAIVSLGFASFSFGWAAFERNRGLKRSEHAQLDRSRDELIKVLESDRDTQKSRYETEHAEFIAHRAKAHELTNEAQARMLRLTEENASLKAKTDITPLMEHQKQQGEINAKVLEGLGQILAHLQEMRHPVLVN